MDHKIKDFLEAAGQRAPEHDGPAVVAELLETLLQARHPGEYVNVDEDGVCVSPVLLVELIRAASGEPVRIGRACFNGAPPCDHAAANAYPAARRCPSCGDVVRERGVDDATFDRLAARPKVLKHLEAHLAGERCECGGTLAPCSGCGFPVCDRCGPDCLC